MSKNVKVYSEVFHSLQGKKIDDLLKNYDATRVSLRQTDDFEFLFCVDNREIPFPKSTGATRVFRVPEEIYDALRAARIHPEESFSIVLFRLVAATTVATPVETVAEKKPYLLKVAPQHKDLFDRFDRYQLAYVCDLIPTEDEVTTLCHQDSGETLYTVSEPFDTVYKMRGWYAESLIMQCDMILADHQAKIDAINDETKRLEALGEPINELYVSFECLVSIARCGFSLFPAPIDPTATTDKHDTYEVLDKVLASDNIVYNAASRVKKDDITELIRIPQHTYHRIAELMKKYNEDCVDRFINYVCDIFSNPKKRRKSTRKTTR